MSDADTNANIEWGNYRPPIQVEEILKKEDGWVGIDEGSFRGLEGFLRIAAEGRLESRPYEYCSDPFPKGRTDKNELGYPRNWIPLACFKEIHRRQKRPTIPDMTSVLDFDGLLRKIVKSEASLPTALKDESLLDKISHEIENNSKNPV